MRRQTAEKTNQQPAKHRFRGIAGFFAASVSAVLLTAAVLAWRSNADHMNGHMSGGAAFSMNIGPLVWTISGISIAFLALLITGLSVRLLHEGKRGSLTLFHVASMVLVLPSAFLFFRLVLR